MKQILGLLLLSMGIYSFGFGIYLSARTLRQEAIRQAVEPRGQIRAQIEADPVRRHSLGLFLLCATGATFGLAGGLHLLLPTPAGKSKKSKKR